MRRPIGGTRDQAASVPVGPPYKNWPTPQIPYKAFATASAPCTTTSSPKRGRDDRIAVGQRREDVSGHLLTQRREEHRLASQRHAAANHHDLRGHERDHLGNGPAERLQGPGRRSAGPPRCPPQPLRLTIRPLSCSIRPPQRARRSAADGSWRFSPAKPSSPGRGDAETAGNRLDRRVRIAGIQPGPQVADLGGDPVSAGVDAAVDHQGAADAAADGDIEDHAMAAARPEKGLGQAGGVGIVGEPGRQAQTSRGTSRPGRSRSSPRPDGW